MTTTGLMKGIRLFSIICMIISIPNFLTQSNYMTSFIASAFLFMYTTLWIKEEIVYNEKKGTTI